MRIRIIADTHFWHQTLVKIWQRQTWFDKKLFNQLKQIPQDDLLIHLWDVLIWKDNELHEKYIQPLKCKKILIMWNHDRKNAMWYMNHWWDFACRYHMIHMWNKIVILSHQPFQHLPEWYINLHGHRHDKDTPRYSKDHYLYSPELEKYKPKLLENCFTHY
jgi:calcineurin-like phosphoesterase family protein